GRPLKECIERELRDRASDFIEQARRLHLLVQDEQQALRFIHPLVRDHFALPFALAELRKKTTQPPYLFQIVVLLPGIRDDRAIEPLLEIGLSNGCSRPNFHFHLDAFNDPRIVRAYARSLSSTEDYYISEWVSRDVPTSLVKLGRNMGADNVARILTD